jgi:hypothetical protein
MLMKPKRTPIGGGLIALGVAALAVLCCAGLPLLVGVLGGLALGAVLGVGSGVVALVVLVTAVLVTRHRRAAACRIADDRRLPS